MDEVTRVNGHSIGLACVFFHAFPCFLIFYHGFVKLGCKMDFKCVILYSVAMSTHLLFSQDCQSFLYPRLALFRWLILQHLIL